MDNLIKDPIAYGGRVLTLILSESNSHKCVRLVKEKGIHSGMVMIGRGTVGSTILNMLGIRSQKKEIVNFLLDQKQVKEVLDYLDQELHLKKPGHGIAYVTLAMNVADPPVQERDKIKKSVKTIQSTEGEIVFRKLTVIVDRGIADDVMDIAREAGVQGGTILHGRGAGAEIAALFGLEIEPEKELVIILTPDSLIDHVVHAVSHGLNLDKPGKGILFVEPILETRGLFETNDNE